MVMRALASVLDPADTLSLEGLADSFQQFAEGLVRRLPYVLAALVALGLTAVVARVVRRTVERALRRGGAERHVVVVVATLAFYGAVAVGLVVALSLGGVNLGVLVGSLGLATVALGFALQDIVSNFTAGIVLLLEHPFTEGDHIAIAEAEGEVEEIQVRATRLRAPDGQLVIVPNKLLFTQVGDQRHRDHAPPGRGPAGDPLRPGRRQGQGAAAGRGGRGRRGRRGPGAPRPHQRPRPGRPQPAPLVLGRLPQRRPAAGPQRAARAAERRPGRRRGLEDSRPNGPGAASGKEVRS